MKLYCIFAVIIVILFLYVKNNIKQKEPKPEPKPKPKQKPKPKSKPKSKPKPKPKEDLVFMDIGINGKHVGKIVIKLFSDIVPKTCENFRKLCNNNNNMSYIKSPFHRIIKDFMIQGGDFTRGNGSGGRSIYGEKFEDENFELSHDQPYLLSMANSGKDSNGSQFFITTNETPHLDGKHVVFGIIKKGFDIIDELNLVETDGNDKPVDDIVILNCGKLN